MEDQVSMDDHRRTLAWVDGSLEWTRTRSQTSLMELLDLVRTEVLFDMDLSGSPPSARDRANVDGPAFGANRGA